MTDRPTQLLPDPFIRRVAEAIDEGSLLAPGDCVVVGVSSGVDSVALLTCLHALASEPGRGYAVTVAHLNHRLRNDADADETFVQSLADALGLPCHIGRVDIRQQAQATGESLETAGRAARYNFLLTVATDVDAAAVATGHHYDDNVETVLHRILRGTHLRGLAGMVPQRPLLSSQVQLIRPLLPLRREEIAAFAGRAEITWREDHTNRDAAFTRNALRHELLPLLADRFNPRIDDAIARLSESARHAEAYLAAAGSVLLAECNPTLAPEGDALTLDLPSLLAAEPLLQGYAMRQALEDFGAPMRHLGHARMAELNALLAAPAPGRLTLPDSILVERSIDQLTFRRGASAPATPTIDTPIFLMIPGVTPIGRTAIGATLTPADPDALTAFIADPPADEQWFDADAIVGPLYAAAREPADRFAPLGASGRQTVGDFLTNAKVSPMDRSHIACLHDDLGIVCVWPMRIDARVRITPTTRRYLKLRARHTKP